MGNLTSTDMIIVIALLAVIVVLVIIICVLDHFSKKKQNEEVETFEEENNLGEQNLEMEVPTLEENLTSEVEVQAAVEAQTVAVNDIEEMPTPIPKVVTNKVEEIRYVEEDEELEKTKAKLELQELKEELKRQEETKKLEEQQKMEAVKIVEEPIVKEDVSVKPVKEEVQELPIVEEVPVKEIEEIETLEVNVSTPVVEEIKGTPSEVSDIANAINEQLIKEEQEFEEANLQKANEVQEDLNEILEISFEDKTREHEDEQERQAIISVEEFNKISDEMYDNNEIIQMSYEDEGDEPISLVELENLYNAKETKEVQLEDFKTIQIDEKEAIIKERKSEIKKMEDLPPIAMEKKFKSSPFISPVYGISETKESIELEQTANLDKLNEEIKKTNEFLKTLKELQKNLD